MGWSEKKWLFTKPDQEPGRFPPWMDTRHIQFLYELVKRGQFKKLLEIGCWNGSSTSAIVQAARDTKNFTTGLHFCDLEFRPLFIDVVRQLADASIEFSLHEKPSASVINASFDCIIVDGDHQLKTVAEELELLMEAGTETIIAHDTQSSVPWFDGSRHLAKILKSCGWYHYHEDSKVRKGEWTERGFLFLTMRHDLYETMTPIWQRLMR